MYPRGRSIDATIRKLLFSNLNEVSVDSFRLDIYVIKCILYEIYINVLLVFAFQNLFVPNLLF